MENTCGEYNKILNILKRIDPCTTDILGRVEKASVYMFCGMKNEWKDNGIEGEFFVCSRSKKPFHCIHILNHEKKQHLMEPMLANWDWKTQESLLLYRKGETIFGIRFDGDEDYSKISIVVGNIMNSLKYKPIQDEIEKPKVNEVLTAPVIVKMLCEAQEDFQKVASLIQGQLLQAHHSSPGEPKLSPDPDMQDLSVMLAALEQDTQDAGKPNNQFMSSDIFQTIDHSDKPDPLSRKQMIFALIYLLKNDNDFVMKLYKAYIKSFMEMLE